MKEKCPELPSPCQECGAKLRYREVKEHKCLHNLFNKFEKLDAANTFLTKQNESNEAAIISLTKQNESNEAAIISLTKQNEANQENLKVLIKSIGQKRIAKDINIKLFSEEELLAAINDESDMLIANTILTTFSKQGVLHIWNNVENGLASHCLGKADPKSKVPSATFITNKILFLGYDSGNIIIFDLTTFVITNMGSHDNSIVALVAIGKTAVLSLSSDGAIKCWSLNTFEFLLENVSTPFRNFVSHCSLNEDQSFVVSDKSELIILTIKEKELSIQIIPNEKHGNVVKVSDTEVAVTRANTIEIIETTKMKTQTTLVGSKKDISHLIFMGETTLVSVSDGNIITIWSTIFNTIQQTIKLDKSTVKILVKIGNKRFAVQPSEGNIRIWSR